MQIAFPDAPAVLPSPAFATHWRDPSARQLDALVHLAGGIAALAAVPMVLSAAGSGPGGVSLPVAAYALAVAVLFPASALFQHGPAAWRGVTIKIDHAAICLKVAATYGILADVSGVELGAVVPALWFLAATGAALRATGPARMRAGSLSIHAIVGFGGLWAIWPALAALSPAAQSLAACAAATCAAGIAFHLADRLRFNQAAWHALVLATSALVSAAVMLELGCAVA